MKKQAPEPQEQRIQATPQEPRKFRYVTPKGRGLDLNGFSCGQITEDRLNGPEGPNLIKAIQNFERERNVKVIGNLILLK